MQILVDHDIEGQAELLWGLISVQGWLEIMDLELLTFADVGLSVNSSDREVWRFAQANRMILLTNNRNMDDEDSLEQTIRDENSITSLPVLTVGNVRRFPDRSYREQCAAQLLEIVMDIERHLGRGRVFIP